MTSSIAGISAFTPSIISNGIFSPRRLDTGADALAAGNPVVAAMNIDIAGSQLLNAAKGVTGIAKESKNALAADIVSAEKSLKAMSDANKFVKGVGKVLSFTAENINPVICAVGVTQVAMSDDKLKTGIEVGGSIATMFGAEYLAKQVLGMPIIEKYNPNDMKETSEGIYNVKDGKNELIAKAGKYKIVNDKQLVISRDALYKDSPFLESCANAIKDYSATTKVFNKSLKFVPPTLKGCGFALSSIGGFTLGKFLTKQITSGMDCNS